MNFLPSLPQHQPTLLRRRHQQQDPPFPHKPKTGKRLPHTTRHIQRRLAEFLAVQTMIARIRTRQTAWMATAQRQMRERRSCMATRRKGKSTTANMLEKARRREKDIRKGRKNIFAWKFARMNTESKRIKTVSIEMIARRELLSNFLGWPKIGNYAF